MLMDTGKKVDFHLHSSFSDGLFSPSRLMEIASAAGLAAAGLTDHDTLKGLPEAHEAALRLGIELVPGVEISVRDRDREIHILGYYPRNCSMLDQVLENLQKQRFKRMEQLVDRMIKLGFKITLEEVLAEAGEAAPGRMHLARILLKKKYVHTTDQAFSLYLNPGKPAYVARDTPGVKDVMDLLLEVEALPVIAHPGAEGKKIVKELIPLGLKGIEVYHPDHGRAEVEYYSNLAAKEGLLVTGGSDYHGESIEHPGYQLQKSIAYSYLEKMKEQLARRHARCQKKEAGGKKIHE